MAFSDFIKMRNNRIAVYIFIINVLLLVILILTLIIPIPDDPPIYHYPFMVYIPYSITFNFLLFIIAGIQLRRNEGKFKERSDNWKFMLMLYNVITWEEEVSLWRRIIKIFTVILLFGAIILFFLIGLVAPPYLFSPMNMFFLPFVFCLLAVWVSYGVKVENIRIVLWLAIILGLYIFLFILALIISQDTMILFITTTYQFIALALILIRLISYIFVEKAK